MPAAVVERRILAKDPANPGKNWVTQTSAPDAIKQLPKFISFVAGALHRNGHSVGESIAIAVGTCRRWKDGGGNVSATTRRRAAEAIAEWDAKRAQTKHGVRNLAVEHHVKGEAPRFKHGWIPLNGAAKEEVAQFGHGHAEGHAEAKQVAKHHGFTDAQIAEATKAMTERAKARQAADKQRHDRGLTGAQAAEEILAKTGHGKQKDTAKADRNALVKHMRAEEQKEAAAAGYTGKIRHGGKAPKETREPSKGAGKGPGRQSPSRGKQRTTKGLSPSIEAQRQELLRRIAAMTNDINARAKGHEQAAAKAHKAGKRHHALRSLGRAVGLRRALHAHHNAAAGVLLGSTTKGAKLRAHLNRAAVRQHGKGKVASGRAFGATAGVAGGATAATAIYGGMHAAKLFGMSNGGSVSIDLAGFKASQQRAPAGSATGGQWAAQGGTAPGSSATAKGRSWSKNQIGHYPASMTDPKQRQQWDNWFRFFAMSPRQQAAFLKKAKGKKPTKPKGAPKAPPAMKFPMSTAGWAPMPTGFSNGGPVRAIDLADTDTTVGGVTDSRSMVVNTVLTKHIRSAHGMKVPKGTAPGRTAKLHKALHARGGAGHSHKGGGYSNVAQQSFDLSTLTTKERKTTRRFGLPSEGKYPMPDKSHAANAKARAAQQLKAGRLTQSQHDRIVRMANKLLGKSSSTNMSNVMGDPAMALGRVLSINLARSGGKMSPYRPKGAERQRVVEHLRAARALHRSGRTKQARSVHTALIASATNRARVMPDGSRRAHTGQEAKIGLLILKRQSMVPGTGIADGKVTQPRHGADQHQAKAKGPQVPTERGGRPQQAKGTTPTPQVAGKPGRLAAIPQGPGGTAPSPQVPTSTRSRYGGPR